MELAIVSAKSNRLLGSIALSSVERLHARAMVTYWVLPEARGRGVASDAVQLLARWALGDLGLKRIRNELDRMHLVTLATSQGTVAQRTELTHDQRRILKALELPEPPRFYDFAPAASPAE